MTPTGSNYEVKQMNQDDDSAVVRQVTPEITTISIPFAQFGVLKTGGRTTVVRLRSGALVVVSPVALTATSREAISSAGGDVKYIVAPNLEHYLHIAAWKAEFPNASLIVPQGLPEKCEKKPALRDTQFDVVITGSTSEPTVSQEFDDEFFVEYVEAIASHDIVLLHKPTCTLIEADLLFNVPAKEQFFKSEDSPTSGFFNGLVGRVFSAEAPATWQKRLGWYVLGASDRSKFRQSLGRIHAWDFDRIVPCHGDVIENGAKEVFETVFEWYLFGKN
ncbi:hypothetical protein FALCPG4_003990 [Fusarium falciforme]